MAENFYSILTSAGLAKLANAQVTGKKVDLTEIAVGDGGGTYYNPTQNDIQLRNEVWRGNIGSVEIDPENPNWIVIESYIPSTDGGFTVREVGIFDAEGDMIAIGKYPETFKPSLKEGASKDLLLRMIIEVTNASAVTLKIDPGVIIASRKYVDEKVGVVSNNLMQLQQDFMSHSADSIQHITSNERVKWNTMFPVVSEEYNTDPNTTLSAHILTNHGNAPIGGRFWYVLTYFYNGIALDKNRTQIAMDYSTSNFAYRSYRDGTWSDWTIIGSKTNLNTTEKTIVGAINEVSNELDSFSEKGIWTPAIRGSTTFGTPVYVVREGEYVRNGQSVYVRGRILLSSKGGMDGNLEIAGLPFVAGGNYRVATIGVHNNITYPANVKDMSGYIESNVMRPYFNVSGSASLTRVTANDVTDNLLLTFSAVYDI